MTIWSFRRFSHLRPGAFHIALQTHKTQHTQPRGWKNRRTNKHGFGSSLSARRETFLTLFGGFLWAIASKIPTQPPGTLTHPLALADLASESTGGFRAKTDKGILWLPITHSHRNESHLSCHTISACVNHLYEIEIFETILKWILESI